MGKLPWKLSTDDLKLSNELKHDQNETDLTNWIFGCAGDKK